jgi:hypothetical protein
MHYEITRALMAGRVREAQTAARRDRCLRPSWRPFRSPRPRTAWTARTP